jgi:hypothetical protein
MKITLKLSADVAEVLANAMLQVQFTQGGHALLLFYVLFEINMKLRKKLIEGREKIKLQLSPAEVQALLMSFQAGVIEPSDQWSSNEFMRISSELNRLLINHQKVFRYVG